MEDKNIVDVIEKIEEMTDESIRKEIFFVEVDGRKYWIDKGGIKTAIKLPQAMAIHLKSLTGVVDYLKSNIDNLMSEEVFIRVLSENDVIIESKLMGDFKQRPVYLTSTYLEPNRSLNRYIDHEELIISLMSTYAATNDRDKVAALLSKVKVSDESNMTDNGVTQTVSAKKGVSLQEDVELPSIVSLAPYRTFTEIEQPISNFVLRVRKDGSSVSAGLFEADGGAWKNAAMLSIKKWLDEKLKAKGLDAYKVIA
ncbi:hypothetical protein KAR91_61490 [Candidatus Pacearchaeota archaeon]|nr:hypothetical protein [Candidatus Pacearchaeota archaeon]